MRYERRTRTAFAGRVAVVTGAGSGLGQALAIQLAAQGAQLALCDVSADALLETQRQCMSGETGILTELVDVSEAAECHAFARAVVKRYGAADLVFNNAGVIYASALEHADLDEMRRVIDVDLWGVIHGCKAFLPYLIEAHGQIVNISSAFGLISAPSFSAYNAAKFAVRGFSEALSQEMISAGHHVTVSCVYPGGLRTPIFRSGRFGPDQNPAEIADIFDRHVARTSAVAAARKILRGVQARRNKILVGPDAYAADWIARTSGAGYIKLSSAARHVGRRRPSK